jgi:hypothetical protein
MRLRLIKLSVESLTISERDKQPRPVAIAQRPRSERSLCALPSTTDR